MFIEDAWTANIRPQRGRTIHGIEFFYKHVILSGLSIRNGWIMQAKSLRLQDSQSLKNNCNFCETSRLWAFAARRRLMGGDSRFLI